MLNIKRSLKESYVSLAHIRDSWATYTDDLHIISDQICNGGLKSSTRLFGIKNK